MGNIKMAVLSAVVLLVACLYHVTAQDTQGFYLISGFPERRYNSDQIVYGINVNGVNEGDSIEIDNHNLPSKSGDIEVGGVNFGCYLQVTPPKRGAGNLYGAYRGEFRAAALGADDPGIIRETYFKRKTRLLDTRVYTVTIYPSAAGETTLSEDSPKTIGVRFTPGCRTITWCKDRRRNVFTGPRLDLKSIEDAGLYTLRRRLRGRRGWFSQIRVIAAACPMNQFWNTGTEMCANRVTAPTCFNGGVPKDSEDACTCPPLLVGPTCESTVVPAPDDDRFVLAIQGDNYLRCQDLEEGNPRCRGYLFCFHDLYGCSCGLGWQGNNCEQSCSKGTWGAGCSQKCAAGNSDCDSDPYFGGLGPD